jgi:hypothetical protein
MSIAWIVKAFIAGHRAAGSGGQSTGLKPPPQ